MAFSRLILLITLSVACIVQNVSCNQVPVFLWGDLSPGKVRSNPLSKLSTTEFAALVKKEIENDAFTVIFMEETLSVEDISHKDKDGVSFPYLQSIIGKAIYLPSVESPLMALNELANLETVDHVELTENGVSAEIDGDSKKFMVIELKDASEGESRSHLLRKHNDFMESMYNQLVLKYGKVIAVYTARFPSWTVSEKHSRVRRATNSSGTSISLTNLLMYYGELLLQSDNTTTSLGNPSSQSNNVSDTSIETTLVFTDQTVKLYFTLKSGYWYFNELSITDSAGATEELQVVADDANGIYALDQFCYRCGSGASFATVNATKSYTLRFVNLKVQPFFGNTTNSTQGFGDSFNCAGFFSVPIWSGLFVSFVMLAITFYGIMMMMDIKTNDRFDDPKGKTITVSALEG